MANPVPTASEIVRMLPHKLQLRFGSLSGYVRAIIDESRKKLRPGVEIDNESVELIQLAALVFVLDEFFRAGTRAARDSATTFETFGLAGFQVGSATFTANNENTERGEAIANELRNSLGTTVLGRRIRGARSMNQLVETMVREFIRGEAVD